MPALGAKDAAALDAQYYFADDGYGTGGRVPLRSPVVVRVAATSPNRTASGSELLGSDMRAWAERCPMWTIAPMANAGDTSGWMIAASSETLRRYQRGDTAAQWSDVTHMVARVLPDGVVAQAWYRTSDPAAAAREDLLSRVVAAAGQPPPRSALPPNLTQWTRAEVSALLPRLEVQSAISVADNDPGGPSWRLCDSAERGRDQLMASWRSFDQSRWDAGGKPLRPFVAIHRLGPGIDYLAELRRAIAHCTERIGDKSELCADRDINPSLQTDSVVIEGEDTVRFTYRWSGVGEIRGAPACTAGLEAVRATQVGDVVIISSAGTGGPFFTGDAVLPIDTLDELQAQTVVRVKAT